MKSHNEANLKTKVLTFSAKNAILLHSPEHHTSNRCKSWKLFKYRHTYLKLRSLSNDGRCHVISHLKGCVSQITPAKATADLILTPAIADRKRRGNYDANNVTN